MCISALFDLSKRYYGRENGKAVFEGSANVFKEAQKRSTGGASVPDRLQNVAELVRAACRVYEFDHFV